MKGAQRTTARTARESGRTVVDWYAQDERGNVWWFGREGVWRAGTDGAEAGLAMAAAPRVGDGYRMAYEPGVVEDTAEVLEADDQRIVVEQRSDLRPDDVDQLTYDKSQDDIVAQTAGVVGVRPIDWQNRPTFQQVVEFHRHR